MKPDFSYYIVTDIRSKAGALDPLFHLSDYKGQLCYIGYLRTGERAFLNVIPRFDPSRFRCIHTSTVDDYHEFDNGKRMEIITMNRVYCLRRATLDERCAAGVSGIKNRPVTTPYKTSGYYGV